MFTSAKGKATKVGSTATVSGTVYRSYPMLPFTPGWDAPKNGTFSVSGFSGIKFQNGRSFVCMDLHINQLEYIITRVAMICGIR